MSLPSWVAETWGACWTTLFSLRETGRNALERDEDLEEAMSKTLGTFVVTGFGVGLSSEEAQNDLDQRRKRNEQTETTGVISNTGNDAQSALSPAGTPDGEA